MNRTQIALQGIRIFGYLNFIAVLYFLLHTKEGFGKWQLVAIPVAISASGLICYSLLWEKLFPNTPKEVGRKYMSPYIVGSALIVLSGILLLIFSWVGTHGT